MSLLDFLNGKDARLGLGLLAAGGPSTVPLSLGQRLQGAMQGMDAEQDAEIKRQYLRSQMDENTSQIQARQMQMQRDQVINDVVANRLRLRAGSAPQMSGTAPPQGLPSAPLGAMPPAPGGLMAPGGPQPMQAPQGMPPGAGPGIAQGSSPFPFSMEDIATLGVAGFKGADNLFSMFKYANDGVKRESGAYYVDPMTGQQRYFPKVGEGQTVGQNGEVSDAPGYVASNARIKGREAGAIEAAKYPYAVSADRARQTTTAGLDLVPVVRDDGETYFMPRLDVATGGARGGQGGAPQGGGMQGGAMGSAPASGGFRAGRNPITQQSAIALNDNWIKNTYQPTIEAGKAATDLDNNIQALRNIDIKTGWGTEAKANAASVLAGLGISTGNAAMYAANAQKFQSIAMDKLMAMLAAQKGVATEGDADRAKQTFVSLGNTPEANAYVLDLAQAQASVARKRAQYYEQALPMAQKKGDLTEVNRRWAKIQPSIWDDPMMKKWVK